MKRAFTLIELLVVIAIIAILAAILFPVFAQAKEAAKKTATLTQFKQLGTASQIYLTDYDDLFPLAFSFDNANQRWRVGSYHATPTGWTSAAGRNVDPRKTEEEVYVHNAMQPYVKNIDMYAAAGMPLFNVPGMTAVNAGYQPKGINPSFNGILHAWSATAVANPSKVVAFWPGMFKQNLGGVSLSQPMLDCGQNGNQACRFTPDAGPQGGNPAYGYNWYLVGSLSNFTAWLYGRGMPMIAADTSAKMYQFNAPNWPSYAENVNSSPFSSFDPSGPPGSPYWITDCVSPNGTKGGGRTFYPGFFRPDSEFNYTAQQCDFGGG